MFNIVKFAYPLNSWLRSNALEQLALTNVKSQRFYLRLSEADARQIVEARDLSLKNSGRVELSFDVVSHLITVFCSSPYINQDAYAVTVCELVDIFYHMKNETADEIGDTELIELMKDYFDNRCYGSLELLIGRELPHIVEEIRRGRYYRTLHDGNEVWE